MMRPESMIEDAVLITDALVIPGTGDPHWDESARTIIEGVILEVATAARFDGRRSLVTARDLLAEGEDLSDPVIRKLIDAGAEEDDEETTALDVLGACMRVSEEPAVRRAAADFFDRPERERDSVLSTARRHLRALAFPEIADSLGGETFDLADLKRAPMTVYLCLPGRHMGPCGRWLRLFVNLALQAMERTAGAPAAGCPVLFVLDEFASLGHMRQTPPGRSPDMA
jgi:type IV secretion system protein VirD4